MRRWMIAIVAGALAASGCGCPGKSGRRGVGKEKSWGKVKLRRIARLDKEDNKKIKWPKSVRVNPDGKTAYVENLSGMNTMAVDTGTFEVKGFVEHLGRPCEAAFLGGGKRLLVTYLAQVGPDFPTYINEQKPGWQDYDFPSVIAVIDTAALKIERKLPVGVRPKIVMPSPDEKLILNANYSGNSVTATRTDTWQTVATLPVGRHPRGIAFTPDSKRAYVALMGEGALVRIDTSDPGAPRLDGRVQRVGRQPRHVKITRDGKWAYLTLNGDGAVSKIDLGNEQEVARVRVGKEPRTSVFSPDQRYLFVVVYREKKVVVLDLEKMEVVGGAATDTWPVGADVTPDGKQLWVTSYKSHSVIVYAVPRLP